MLSRLWKGCRASLYQLWPPPPRHDQQQEVKGIHRCDPTEARDGQNTALSWQVFSGVLNCPKRNQAIYYIVWKLATVSGRVGCSLQTSHTLFAMHADELHAPCSSLASPGIRLHVEWSQYCFFPLIQVILFKGGEANRCGDWLIVNSPVRIINNSCDQSQVHFPSYI